MVCIGVLLVGLLNMVGGVIVNCFCVLGLIVVVMVVDCICVGEFDVMIVVGVELMSMVLMMGNLLLMLFEIFMCDENVGIVYGMGLIVEKVV